MKPEISFKNFNKINSFWLEELSKYSEEELKVKPSENEWSLGQVYNHLFIINEIILEQISICLEGNNQEKIQEKFAAKVILFFNRLPSRKFRVPRVISHVPSQPESKNEVIDKFNSFFKKIESLIPKIAAADPSQKVVHPSLGSFNAKNWFQFMSIHMKHHLLQKKRLEEFLKSKK